jgi:hypothetical protein
MRSIAPNIGGFLATLAETIQAKITAAEAEVAVLKAQLASTDAAVQSWLAKDVAEVRVFVSSIMQHLRL